MQFQGFGRWVGNAEVFDSFGRFLGNGSDYRHVQLMGDGRIRINVSFIGPFKHSGHYFIEQRDRYRLYEGPANIGYAEVLSENLVDANAYWPALGLSQRFFLMIVGDQLQLSLAQMSRGEHLMYVVVGQNDRVPENIPDPQPTLVSGTHYDLSEDPTCGRGEILLHRSGVWRGILTALDQAGQSLGEFEYSQALELRSPQILCMQIAGGAFNDYPHSACFVTNQWQAWATEESAIVGSYSLSGGRALSGQFYYREAHLRCWQREVTTLDGKQKAIIQHWYRGGQRIGSQFGVLEFEQTDELSTQ